MLHSELIKKLRIERNLSQEELTKDVSQRSTLSSFERQGTRASFEILYAYLQRMNVTLEEYEYMLNSEHLSKQREVSREVSLNFSFPYKTTLAEKLQEEYRKTGNFFYYSLYAQYCLVRHHSKDKIPKAELNKISKNVKSYLNRIQTWGRFELVLFSNCLFLFGDEYIYYQFTNAIHHMRLYKDSANYSNDLLKFLINGMNLSYSRKSAKNSKLFWNELKKIACDYDDVKAKMICKVFELLFNHDNGVDNLEEKFELLLTLKILDESYWIEFINEHYQ